MDQGVQNMIICEKIAFFKNSIKAIFKKNIIILKCGIENRALIYV